MATIVQEVPGITLDLDAATMEDYDRDDVIELFRELEFRSLVTRLPAHISDAPGPSARPWRRARRSPRRATRSSPRSPRSTALVSEVKRAGRFAFDVVADDPHPMRAADHLVGLGFSIEAGSGWYVPFGHTQPPCSLLRPASSARDGDGAPRPFQLTPQPRC